MVASSMHPAADADGLAETFAVDAAAVVGAFHLLLPNSQPWRAESPLPRAAGEGPECGSSISVLERGGRCRLVRGELVRREQRVRLRCHDAHRDDVFQRLI